jgi:SpoVK/Ycf46/Vps4 family AAA+-type ATPase
MDHYTTSLEHVLAALERLDLLIQVQVWRARQGHNNEEELPALYIPETEVDALLDKAIGSPSWANVPVPPDMQERIQHWLDQMAEAISQHAEESRRQGVFPRLVALVQRFDLVTFDLNVILVCLAPEIDRRYERLYAYLQDDVTRRHPTIDLVLNLFCPGLENKVAMRARFTPAAPLLQHHLLRLADDPHQRSPSLLSKSLQLDPRVARDAHDRYANVEISYLLQKMEEYDGVVILATNLRKNMDDAFVRRLHFTLEFPLPDVIDRLRIWEQIWPVATPCSPELDLAYLARRIEVAGGNIRNIALASAFLAVADGGVVTMRHLLHATQREYQKMGKVLTTKEFGDYTA